ncbi:MAG: WS/DGAT domain-containing protein [Mycobacterium sp.]
MLPFFGPTVANTTVTNVPGPPQPIFFSGVRLLRAAGLGPLIGAVNLIHVVASYHATLSISATADRDALPGPATYAQCMEKASQQLVAGALRWLNLSDPVRLLPQRVSRSVAEGTPSASTATSSWTPEPRPSSKA